MGKIPVGRTIAETYSFTFSRYFPLLGVVWLPMVATWVAAYFLLRPVFRAFGDLLQAGIGGHDDAAAQAFANRIAALQPGTSSFNILVFLITAYISVGVVKEALGLRKGPRFVYLAFGDDELRVIGGYFLLYVIAIGAMIAFFVIGGIAAVVVGVSLGSLAHTDSPAEGWAVVAAAVALIGAFCAAIYCGVRLSYLLVPVTIAEKRFGILRSWELTKGNFWRIFVVFIATWIPLLIMEWVAFAILFLPFLMNAIRMAPKNPEAVAALIHTTMQGMIGYVPFLLLGALALAPIFYGLMTTPAAFAYRALVPAGSLEPSHDGST